MARQYKRHYQGGRGKGIGAGLMAMSLAPQLLG